MQLPYVALLAFCGLVAGVVISAGVWYDLRDRGLTAPTRLLVAAGFGAVSFAGFLVPHVYDQQLSHIYFQVLKPKPIAVSPHEWLAVSVATGLVVTVLVAVLYVAGVRRVLSDRTRNSQS